MARGHRGNQGRPWPPVRKEIRGGGGAVVEFDGYGLGLRKHKVGDFF
jgi:hypothetical protein